MPHRTHPGRYIRKSREELRRDLPEPPAIHFEPHEVSYFEQEYAHLVQPVSDPWDEQISLHEQDEPESDPDRAPKRDIWA